MPAERGTRSRLAANLMASGLGPLLTLGIQLINVPLFLKYWGAELYGEWLLLSAIPVYMSLSDFGFGSVAGNDMAMSVAAGNRRSALETFQSTWALILALSICLSVCSAGSFAFFPIKELLHVKTLTSATVKVIFALQCVEVLAILQWGLLAAGFRSEGMYAICTVCLNGMRACTALTVLILLTNGGSAAQVAFGSAAVRVVGTMMTGYLLNSRFPWIRHGFSAATASRIRSLFSPALAFMALPLGNALSMEGMLIVIGTVMGPASVALFAPLRTLTRAGFQVAEVAKNAVTPELSAAFGKKNMSRARDLHRHSCLVVFWGSWPILFGLYWKGPAFFRVWTRGRLTFDRTTFFLLLAVVMANSLWNTSSAVAIATNTHRKLALRYLLGTTGSILLAFGLVYLSGLPGAALALLLSDIWMTCFVVRASNIFLQDRPKLFLVAMINPVTLITLAKSAIRMRTNVRTALAKVSKDLPA